MRISKDPQVRKEEIIKIAEELFLQQGVEKTSIAQIAQSVGVAKGLVYYYFKTKEEVLTDVVKDISLQHLKYLEERLALEGNDFFERLMILIDAYYNIYPFRNDGVSSVFQLEQQLVTLFHRQFVHECQGVYQKIIREGQGLGFFNQECPEEKLLITLEGVFGLSNLRKVEKELLALLVEQMLNLPPKSLVELSNRLLTSVES